VFEPLFAARGGRLGPRRRAFRRGVQGGAAADAKALERAG
jgi:hypothetical protein